MLPRGTLRLILGNMFSNKTGMLIHEVSTLREFGHKKVLVFKPSTDTRSGAGRIMNFRKECLECRDVPAQHPLRTLSVIRVEEARLGAAYDVIVFDEMQFFRPRPFYTLIDELLRRGYDVIAAGLRLDFKGEPFGASLMLIGLCENIQQVSILASYCTRCGKPAHLPQRLIDGKPAPYGSPQIKVGGKESYEPRCYAHFELPGRASHP